MADIENQPQDERYSRQERFAPIGAAGQQRLRASRVTLIGCGALGSVIAELLVRAGVGMLRIVDRDFLELSNLQRQTLYDEKDVAENLPKAVAAARKLAAINGEAALEPIVADANPDTIEQFVDGADLILDGTDNLLTRFLVNDVAVKHGIPWVYGACLAAEGMMMVIRPAGRPCLRCVLDEPPAPGAMPTCETAGIIGPIVTLVGALEAAEALKLLTGNEAACYDGLLKVDLWTNRITPAGLEQLQDGCKCCRDGRFEFLQGRGSLSTVSLCGRKSVQVRPRKGSGGVDLAELADRLKDVGPLTLNEYILRLTLADGREMTVFADGRAIVKGTSDVDAARSLYAKFVGH